MPPKPVPTRLDMTAPGAAQVLSRALAGVDLSGVEHGNGRVVGVIRVVDVIGVVTGDQVREYRVDYKLLASRGWGATRRQAAGRVAAHWCKGIGNVDRVDKPMMSHILQRLRHYTEMELHCAVAAYAASPWHREKKAWMRPRRFFVENGVIAEWLNKSPDYQRLIRARSASEGACSAPPANRAATVRERSSCPQPSALSTQDSSVISLTDADLLAAYAAQQTDLAAHRARWDAWSALRDAAYARAWESTDPADRQRIVAEVERSSARGIRRDGTAICDRDAPEFRFRCHAAAWHAAMARPLGERRAFAYPAFIAPPATARYALDAVHREIRRRKLDPDRPAGGPPEPKRTPNG